MGQVIHRHTNVPDARRHREGVRAEYRLMALTISAQTIALPVRTPSFSTMSLAFELIVLVLVSVEIDGLGRFSAPDQLLFAGVIQIHHQRPHRDSRSLVWPWTIPSPQPPHPRGQSVPQPDKFTLFPSLMATW